MRSAADERAIVSAGTVMTSLRFVRHALPIAAPLRLVEAEPRDQSAITSLPQAFAGRASSQRGQAGSSGNDTGVVARRRARSRRWRSIASTNHGRTDRFQETRLTVDSPKIQWQQNSGMDRGTDGVRRIL
jgi:hypothetical protein